MKTERRIYWHFSAIQILRILMFAFVGIVIVMFLVAPDKLATAFAWLVSRLKIFVDTLNQSFS